MQRPLIFAVLALLTGCAGQPPGSLYGPKPRVGYRPQLPIVYAPQPGVPIANPNPTTPISDPTPVEPNPTGPPAGHEAAWSPWPLPPNQQLLASVSPSPVTPSPITQVSHSDSFTIVAEDRPLKYRGGRTIRDLKYVNLYVGGESAWDPADAEHVEASIEAAMTDDRLNGVLQQYFDGPPITAAALPPHPLGEYVPDLVSRGDVRNYVLHLDRLGYLKGFDFETTVFNLLLPPGTVLSDQTAAAHTVPRSEASAEAVNSLAGLGGYHGSVVPGDGRRIYFSASVAAERAGDGRTNGVPVFAEPWKNLVAAVYHQMMEVRTDPDVEDALRDGSDLDAGVLGWVSDDGREIGDFLDADPLSDVIREVPVADGGTVPVQLPYSNADGGPRG